MFFVQAGMVAVVVGEERVDTLTTGDFFGEVALTVSKQRTADVVSLGDVSTQNNLVSEYDLLIAGCEQEREARALSLGLSLSTRIRQKIICSRRKQNFFVIL